MNDKIIQLDKPIAGGAMRGSLAQFAHADLVITAEGQVIKDRYGMGNRPATEEELKAAKLVEVET